MHDIKYIRANPQEFDAKLARRGLAPQSPVILKLDEEKRNLQTELQKIQSEKNRIAKEIGIAMSKGDKVQAESLKASVTNTAIVPYENEADKKEQELKYILSSLPNLPADDVDYGTDEHGNKEVRMVGHRTVMSFKAKLHDELGVALNMMDFDAAAKMSGARFVVLKGALAKMERALASFMLDIHTSTDNPDLGGYTEHVPPYLVKKSTMYGTGQLPKFEEDLFECFAELRKLELERNLLTGKYVEQEIAYSLLDKIYKRLDAAMREAKNQGQDVSWVASAFSEMSSIFTNYSNSFKNFFGQFEGINSKFLELQKSGIEKKYLIPTAEVPLTNLVADSIVDEDSLPLRMTAYTPCFRSEAGAAGKDTRGMIRQHQFSKVELVSIVHPDKSQEEHERMTACAEEILKRLGLCYRVMLLCTGDMGFSAQKTYDIEVWMPGQNLFREISSCSNCGAFQARRMKARFKGKNSKETQFVHTLNGSGLAIGRTMVAILENYQQADGSIVVPEALRPYMGGLEKIVAA